MQDPFRPRRIPAVVRTALMPVCLVVSTQVLAGGAVGPGVITLPPIFGRYDDQCLKRIDAHDDRLAARQSRECRKPRGSRNGLPTVHGAEPVSPLKPTQPVQNP